MPPSASSLATLVLGPTVRVRTRVSQLLLAVLPLLLLLQGLLVLGWHLGHTGGAEVALYVVTTSTLASAAYVAIRFGFAERWFREPSLTAPLMVMAMVSVAWAYALVDVLGAAVLCLMPLVLCFGIFALEPRSARRMARFGVVLIGAVTAWLAWRDPAGHPPLREAVNGSFVAAAMVMTQVLAGRLGRLRARLRAQRGELSRAVDRIRLLATRDELTGLLNRRAGQDELLREAGLAARGRRTLTVALLDLDHFKQVNDRYGHQAGDRVLQTFARVGARELRAADRLVRWGGEEFLFILPETGAAEARVCLDRLHESYLRCAVDGIPDSHRLGFSAGIASWRAADDIAALLERADRALYAAKVAGRGRVVCAPGEPAATG